jgi:hypothetical protein
MDTYEKRSTHDKKHKINHLKKGKEINQSRDVKTGKKVDRR